MNRVSVFVDGENISAVHAPGILAAARALIAERGMEGLTVVAVARRAGLNRSTAYQHFPKRDDLVNAVAADFAVEVRRIFAEERPFGDQIDFFVDYFFENPDIARIWMFQLLTGHADGSPGWGEYVGAIERLASSRKSQDGIDPEMFGVIGVASALVWSSGRNPSSPRSPSIAPKSSDHQNVRAAAAAAKRPAAAR